MNRLGFHIGGDALVGTELADMATAEVQKIIKSRWRRIRVAMNIALCERALGIADVAYTQKAAPAAGAAAAADAAPAAAKATVDVVSGYVPTALYGGGGNMTVVDPGAAFDAIPGNAPRCATPTPPPDDGPRTPRPGRRRRSRTRSFGDRPEGGANPFDADPAAHTEDLIVPAEAGDETAVEPQSRL